MEGLSIYEGTPLDKSQSNMFMIDQVLTVILAAFLGLGKKLRSLLRGVMDIQGYKN